MKRILLVEDNVILAKVLCFALEAKGFSVQVAHDGRAALEFAQQDVFDVVITDYAMPEMNGADLCRHLRADGRYNHTPIIMLSAFCRDLDIAKLHDELRLSAFLSKPFSPADLITKLEVLTECHG